jgi:hypothetical protein
MSFGQQKLHMNDCDSMCQEMRGVPHSVLTLYNIAAADMSIDIVMFVVMIAMWIKNTGDEDNDKGPLNGIWRYFLFFAFIDFVLQISSLVYAQIINDSATKFFDARCLVTTTRTGIEHQETLAKLVESVKTAAVLGWIELVLMIGEVIGEVGNTVYEQTTKETSVSRMLAYIIMTLQVGQVVLAIVDFVVFASSAWHDADKLFTDSIAELSHLADSNNWCVALTNKSTLCLEIERRDGAAVNVVVKGRRLPPLVGFGAVTPATMPPTSSWPPLQGGAAAAGMLVIGIAAIVIVAIRWSRTRQV